MQHLLSHSVYQDLSLFGSDPVEMLRSMGCDGLELLTGYDVPDAMYMGVTRTVHLPYAPDWLSAWEDRPSDMSDTDALFFMYGRNHQDVIDNIERAIMYASSLHPAHGVFHACNTDITEVFHRTYSRRDSYVVDALCDMINEVITRFPGGEPPFRMVFENLWWPGLRLLDDSGFRILERRLEFDDWGICLDTGHMMSCLPTESQEDGIDMLIDVFHGYPQDMIDRISGVHLHWSASAEYRRTFEEKELYLPYSDYLRDANIHVSKIDMHRPFTDPRCRELIDILAPEYVIHEMLGSGYEVIDGFRTQRSHFP